MGSSQNCLITRLSPCVLYFGWTSSELGSFIYHSQNKYQQTWGSATQQLYKHKSEWNMSYLLEVWVRLGGLNWICRIKMLVYLTGTWLFCQGVILAVFGSSSALSPRINFRLATDSPLSLGINWECTLVASEASTDWLAWGTLFGSKYFSWRSRAPLDRI